MKLFKETVVLESSKNREEIIALIDKKIEPYHKDGSKLMFEGRISAEGDFNLNMAPSGTAYRSYSRIVDIKGRVSEDKNNASVTEIVFSISKISKTITIMASIFFISIALLLFYSTIGRPNIPYYVPLIFYVFFMINVKLTFQAQVNKALNGLKVVIL